MSDSITLTLKDIRAEMERLRGLEETHDRKREEYKAKADALEMTLLIMHAKLVSGVVSATTEEKEAIKEAVTKVFAFRPIPLKTKEICEVGAQINLVIDYQKLRHVLYSSFGKTFVENWEGKRGVWSLRKNPLADSQKPEPELEFETDDEETEAHDVA